MARRALFVLLVLAATQLVAAGPAGAWRDDFTGTKLNPAWRAQDCPFAQKPVRQIVPDCTPDRVTVAGGELRILATPRRGGVVGTFDMNGGWPAVARRAWRVPFAMSARIRMPSKRAMWSTFLAHRVDVPVWLKGTAQSIWEGDIIEGRTGRARQPKTAKGEALIGTAACYLHEWVAGRHGPTPAGYVKVAGLDQWNTYTLTATRTATSFYVNGRLCRRLGPIRGWYGAHFQSIAALSNRWVGGYATAMTGRSLYRVAWFEAKNLP